MNWFYVLKGELKKINGQGLLEYLCLISLVSISLISAMSVLVSELIKLFDVLNIP